MLLQHCPKRIVLVSNDTPEKVRSRRRKRSGFSLAWENGHAVYWRIIGGNDDTNTKLYIIVLLLWE